MPLKSVSDASVSDASPAAGTANELPLAIPPELAHAMAFDQVVLFAGPVFDRSAGAPGAVEIFTELQKLAKLTLVGSYVADFRAEKAPDAAVHEALETIAAMVPAVELRSHLEVILSKRKSRASSLHAKVAKLDFAGVVSTSWDHGFEEVFDQAPALLPSDSERLVAAQSARPFLLKLHGDPRLNGSYVLTRGDLQRVVRKNELLSKFLNSCWASNTFLFVVFRIEAIADSLRAIGLERKVRHGTSR